MEIRQNGFEKNWKNQPKNWQAFLKLGKVIGVDQGQKTVDVSMMDGSGTYYKVTVLAPAASTASGISHLPQMHLPDPDRDEPAAFSKRDIYAIIGFVDGVGTMPVVLGFKYPELNQMSFSNKAGFENQQLERHEGDQYQRIIGDTVDELGGEDKASEVETRYPDNSYFKAYKSGGTKKLTNISQDNDDADVQPFKVKKEEKKGFYFQHSSGTRILIDPDGQIKMSHHTGTWLSISPNDANISAESVDLETIDSQANPPSAANSAPVKVHLEHSSGSTITINTDGKIEISGVKGIDVKAVGAITNTSFSSVSIKAPTINLN